MIGIIGMGSIGQRHARNLYKLGIKNIAALRTNRGVMKQLPDDLEFIKEFSDRNDFYDNNLDGVIVANPTSLHLEAALPALQRGIKTFIEKPITENVEKAIRLKEFSDLIIVGYCFRFSKFINVIKKFIDKGNLGKLYKASFYRSYYLPKWHPYADYRLEYTAQKKLGGGVIRTLSHEIDLMHFLFGDVESANGLVDKVSDLDIDTDDFCFFTCKMKQGGRVNFEMDFLSPDYINRAEIIGSKGRLVYDMQDVTFTKMNGEKEILHVFSTDEFDEMYLDQMKDFLQFINDGTSFNCSYNDAVAILDIIEKIDK
jgi:predicted dehydrogenase